MDKVIDFLANKIVSCFVKKNCIPKEKEELYRYSVVVVLQSAITIITMLLIGLLFDKFLENLCFMIVLKLLRNFSGGLHSSKFSVCYSISAISNMLVMLFLYIMELYGNYLLVMFFEIVSVIVVVMFAPVVNDNKPISYKEYCVYRILVITISVLLVIVSVLFIMWRPTVTYVICITMTLNCILILVEEIKNTLSKKE